MNFIKLIHPHSLERERDALLHRNLQACVLRIASSGCAGVQKYPAKRSRVSRDFSDLFPLPGADG